MDISLIISSNTKQFDNLLYHCIQSAINGIPDNCEVIVVSPHDIPREFPNTRFIKDPESKGCAVGFNLGVANSNAKYVALCPDDYHMHHGWWNVMNFMQNNNVSYASFLNGSMGGISYAHLPIIERSLLESDVMRGKIYNPTFFHQYLDNDLGFRLHFLKNMNAPVMQNGHWVNDGMQADTNKWPSKMKYLCLDGVVFHAIWGRKVDLSNNYLHHQSSYAHDTIRDMAIEQLKNDEYKGLYIDIPDQKPPSGWIPTMDPITVGWDISETQKKIWGHLMAVNEVKPRDEQSQVA